MDYVVVPLNLLPSERENPPNPDDVEKERAYIRENILPKDNSSLVEDEEAMRLLNELGSDLNINAFAVNFRYPDGSLNTSVEEANWLNRRIFEALSVTDPNEDPRAIPFYLTSTTFAEADYGECADRFKARLGLEGKQDLFVLRNVVMSPFTTTYDFMPELIQAFTDVVEKEVKVTIFLLNTYFRCTYTLLFFLPFHSTLLHGTRSSQSSIRSWPLGRTNSTLCINRLSIWRVEDVSSSSLPMFLKKTSILWRALAAPVTVLRLCKISLLFLSTRSKMASPSTGRSTPIPIRMSDFSFRRPQPVLICHSYY